MSPRRLPDQKPKQAPTKAATKARPKAAANPAKKAPKKIEPAARRAPTSRPSPEAWAATLDRTRPGLMPFVLDRLAELYGRHEWRRRLDPVSELVLTILSQNSADVNAERAFEALRER